MVLLRSRGGDVRGGVETQNVPIPHQECISPIHKSSPFPPAEWRRPFSVGHWGERGWEQFSGPRKRHLWETTLALNTHTNSAMCCSVQTTARTNVSKEQPTHHASSLPLCVMAFKEYLSFKAGRRVSRLKYPHRHRLELWGWGTEVQRFMAPSKKKWSRFILKLKRMPIHDWK